MVRQSARKVAQAVASVASVKTKANNAKATTVAESKIEVAKTKASKRKTTPTEPELGGEDIENISPAEDKKPAPKKRKTTKKDAEDATPLAARTAVTSLKRAMYIGAHVSSAGGVQNSIQNATNIGGNAFALFLKSQRKWVSPPLADEAKTQFHAMLKEHSFDARKHIVPHGSYLVNLAQADEAKATQAYDGFLDDLQRCEALGITLYNFHPGSTGGATMDAACARIAAQLNRAHKATKTVVTLLENMCGSGNVVGSRFEELRDIIALVDDKARVGVCIDTCHAFAAGYDLRTPEAFAKTMAEFDSVVGLQYLRAFHLNDSKAPFGSHRDLHANIGTGCLGLRAFHNIMNHEPLQGLPMVLETPIDEKGPDGKTVENKQIWADEIKLLESLIGMDADSDEFKEKEKELNAKGASERQKIQEQVDKKAGKDAKKGTKGKAKGRKSKKDEDSCDSCGESD
ncbi:xylose isomerase-like protein [Chaetomium sp. MPI-CAGE-AT-0009]|nr:xylose isomerase-like protein [Chaetomium sp. MPI-CAGE-AT-0009]